MADWRNPKRSMLILGGLTWVCAASLTAGAVLMWVTAFESQRWAPAIISTVFVLIVLGWAIQLSVLTRRYRRQSQYEPDARSNDGE